MIKMKVPDFKVGQDIFYVPENGLSLQFLTIKEFTYAKDSEFSVLLSFKELRQELFFDPKIMCTTYDDAKTRLKFNFNCMLASYNGVYVSRCVEGV